MSKYSLIKRLLTENEEDIVSKHFGAKPIAATPKRRTTGYNSLQGKVEFAEGDSKIEMHVSYDPFNFFSEQEELYPIVRDVGAEITVMVPLPEPHTRNTPTFRRGGVKVGGTDFAEIMAAMWLHSDKKQKVEIQGEGSNFDILVGGEKWEVKKFGGSKNKDTGAEYLYASSAVRTGKTGRGIADEGLFDIATLVRNLKKMYEKIDEIKSRANPDDLPPRVDELRTACYQLVHRPIGNMKPTSALKRTGSGEWGKNIFKESPQWIEDLRTVDEIIEAYNCDMPSGPPYSIMTSSDWADMYLCEILDAAPESIKNNSIEEILEFVGVSLVGSARGIAGVDEKSIFKKVLQEYFERSGITGFVFVRGFPAGDDYERGRDMDPIAITFLNQNQVMDAVDRGEIILAISQKTITISYKKGSEYEVISELLSSQITLDKELEEIFPQLGEEPEFPGMPATGAGGISSSVIDAALTQQQLEEQRRMQTLFEWALSGKRYKQ